MKIQLVNEHDELIGVKERSEVDYETDIYRLSTLWLTNSKSQTLLAKRATTKDKDPGKWGPAVAGTNDDGETYEQNIYKEAAEEIGLTGVRFEKGSKIFITFPRRCFLQWYLATIDRDIDSFVMQATEVDELAWVDIAELKQELLTNPEAYVPAMRQLVESLGIQ